MNQQPVEMDIGKTLYCLEVLQAVQTDSHTSGWYWGDVRGQAGVGVATNALWRRDLICSGVGRSTVSTHTERGSVSQDS